ncbi:protein mono-ADP-ribosyltransferase PARP12-like [Brachyhypopomus gauderio]|uniref:protein mono-ADP-ribosyltransferase PARP12-like n=1 Tax=Brachyhypopomus gauderio TaxID=698409 RepID=UPI004040F613
MCKCVKPRRHSRMGTMATDSVLKIICDNSGSVEYNRLLEITSCRTDIDCLDAVVQNSDCFAFIQRNGCKHVIVRTNLKLCKTECQNSCNDLHLCKFYILGECSRRWCSFGHSLESEHNSRILRDRNLHNLNKNQLRVLLLQSDSSLLPHVCVSYNKGSGEYGNCPDKEACNRLHICENYIRGTCEGTTECSRSHDFYEPHPMKSIQAKRVPSQLMGSLYLIYQNILALKHHGSAMGETATKRTRNENKICLSFVKGYCKFQDNCWRVHFDMPYKWELEVGKVWTDLADNEIIERDFCDPTKIHSVGVEPVYFETMTQGLHRVRRLTTESSVVEPNFSLTTKWTWYWEDEYRTWIKYGSIREMHRLSSINSEELENKYIQFLKENNNAVVTFTAGKQCYEINFTDMKQRNQLTGVERPVRRRPVFVSSSEVQTIRTTRKRSAHCSSYKGLPGFWDKTAIPDTGFQRVLLSTSDKDYIKVQEHFKKTMKCSIVKIERVQNKDLWEDFQTKRERMKKANKNKKYGEGERLLFHGTKSSHIAAICKENFDMRVSGVNGTVFGQGTYFARDAKYSHSYTDECGEKFMFACRVLVGQYTKGDSQYRRPPARDAAGTLYDCCVNDIRDPTIYVVFDRAQVYPEFLITYKEDTFTRAYGGYTLGRSTSSDIVPNSNPTAFLDVGQHSYTSGVTMSKTASSLDNVHAVSSSSVSAGQVSPSPNISTVSAPLVVLDSVSTRQVSPSPNITTVSTPLVVLDSVTTRQVSPSPNRTTVSTPLVVFDSVTTRQVSPSPNRTTVSTPLVVLDSVTTRQVSASTNRTTVSTPLVVLDSVPTRQVSASTNRTTVSTPLVVLDSVTTRQVSASTNRTTVSTPLVVLDSVPTRQVSASTNRTTVSTPLVVLDSVTTRQVSDSPNITTVKSPLVVLDSVSTKQVSPSPNITTVSPPLVVDSVSTKQVSPSSNISTVSMPLGVLPSAAHYSVNSAHCSSAGLPAKSSQDKPTAATFATFYRSSDLLANPVKPSLSGNADHFEDAKNKKTGSSYTSNSPTTRELGADFDLLGFSSFSTRPSQTSACSFSNSSGVSFSQTNASLSSTHKPSTSTNIQEARGYRKPSPPKHVQKSDCVMQ